MTGRFTIRNASRYPTDEVRQIVKFAMSEVDVRGVCVNVKRLRGAGWKGWAYEGVPYVSNAPSQADYLITLAVGEALPFPVKPRHIRRGEPMWGLEDWREAFVFLAAHEAKHIEQYRENLPRSEVACNCFAAYMLDRFRSEVPA